MIHSTEIADTRIRTPHMKVSSRYFISFLIPTLKHIIFSFNSCRLKGRRSEKLQRGKYCDYFFVPQEHQIWSWNF